MHSYFANLIFVVNAAQDSSALAGVEGRFTREVLLAGRHGVDSRRNPFTAEATLHLLVARHALFSHPCEAQVRARHPLADLDAERARVAAYISGCGAQAVGCRCCRRRRGGARRRCEAQRAAREPERHPRGDGARP